MPACPGGGWRAIGLVLTAQPASAADHLDEARGYYNQELFELAMKSADLARADLTVADEASLIIARANLERYPPDARSARTSTAARDALRVMDATKLSPASQAELTLGLGEWLFLDDRYGAAAELFDAALGATDALGPVGARPRARLVGDLGRSPRAGDPAHRTELYQRIVDRMDEELRAHPGSTAAAYWLPAAARSMGDLDRAWTVRDRRLAPRPRRAGHRAPRFGPISIGSCRPRSFPSARARWRARHATRAKPWTR